MNEEQLQEMGSGRGFIAALDQSGGSTPKALALYGIPEEAYGNETQMFDLIHQARVAADRESQLQPRQDPGNHPVRADDRSDHQRREHRRVSVEAETHRAVRQGRPGTRRRAIRRPADETDDQARHVARSRRRAGHLRHQNALVHPGAQRRRNQGGRPTAVRHRRANRTVRTDSDPRARGQHQKPRQADR